MARSGYQRQRTIKPVLPFPLPRAVCGLALSVAAFAVVTTVRGQTQTPSTIAPIPLTLSATNAAATDAYTQNFDTLASSGTSSTLPAGFGFVEKGSNPNSTYTAGNGSSTLGDTYSFGSSGSTDRAFGTLLSGSVTSTVGAVFKNSSGGTLTSLTISFTGEQWRYGATGRTDRLDFQYNQNAGSLTATTGAFVDFDALDFNAPTTLSAAAALDGNLAANRTVITATITGLTISDGQTFALRFVDFDAAGADDGLGIDDFSITGGVAPVPEPGTMLGGLLLVGAAGWGLRRRRNP